MLERVDIKQTKIPKDMCWKLKSRKQVFFTTANELRQLATAGQAFLLHNVSRI